MFWNKKEDLIIDRIAEFLKSNYDFGTQLNDRLYKHISKKNILIVLEIYAYLNCLSDIFLNQNRVENNIRRLMFDYSWKALTTTKIWSSLTLTEDEINKFVDNRIENYAKILNKYNGINVNYIEKIIEYQIQLIMEIINNNKLSFYNPLPFQINEYSPIHIGLVEISELNSILHDFFINIVIPYTKITSNNLNNDYFTNKNYIIMK